MSDSARVVVLGMLTKIPVPGVAWQVVHYVLGLRRLGVDVYYAEIHGRNPATFMTGGDDGARAAADHIASVMEPFDLGDRWAFRASHSDGACYGLTEKRLSEVIASADLLINLHGGTKAVPEIRHSERLVLIETDPVRLQIELARGQEEALLFVEAHGGLFTFAEGLGAPDCLLPGLNRFNFKPTRQPVINDLWTSGGPVGLGSFTTIGSFRQKGKDIRFRGDTYHWSKHHEFLKVIDLPFETSCDFELAMTGFDDGDQERMEGAGWRIKDAGDLGLGLEPYRSYIQSSKAEFTVAKDQNVRLRTGWFSDRSATYLAAGKPVVTQDTGFGALLPTGDGLLAFTDIDEAREAVLRVTKDYEGHCRAAHHIAGEYFSSDKVLGALLDEVGLSAPGRVSPSNRIVPPPSDLDLTPTSRWPTTLADSTIARVAGRPLPGLMLSRPHNPDVSLVVVTHDDLVCSRLAIETMLMNTRRDDVELIVVDNSAPGPLKTYLARLDKRVGRLSLLDQESNVGFATALNRGIEAASGRYLVFCNNDIIVPSGWLKPLLRLLDRPGVGMVGPSTNRAANEAQVETDYSDYGGFVRFARAFQQHRTSPVEVGTLLMFCAATRRDVLARVGLLDESYGVALFEDDDFSRRVTEAGFRLLCARDSFVHHFGQVSVGKLRTQGAYDELFESNRERFESKWSESWSSHERIPGPRYQSELRAMSELLSDVLPANASLAIATRGDDRMLSIGSWPAVHFPTDDDATYSGYHPANTDDLIGRIRRLSRLGVSHLVIPVSASWWLDRYEGLSTYLSSNCDVVVAPSGACGVWALPGAADD